MLSDLEFSQWCERLQLSEAARRYIESVRKSDPARAVTSNGKGNVCSTLASESMGLTINTESRTAEFAYAREFEFDEDVLEFWDQPQPVPVLRHGLSGPRSGTYPRLLSALERRSRCHRDQAPGGSSQVRREGA